jgi:hypothetical protein
VLILVPMLFVLPVGLVPLAVAAGIVVGSLEECVRGSLRVSRIPMRLMIAWHAVGPALVFVILIASLERYGDSMMAPPKIELSIT